MTPRLRALAHLTYRQARKVVVLVIGSTLVLLGVTLVFLPGPGLLVGTFGLGILSLEFAFARRWLQTVRATASSGLAGIKQRFGPAPADPARESPPRSEHPHDV